MLSTASSASLPAAAPCSLGLQVLGEVAVPGPRGLSWRPVGPAQYAQAPTRRRGCLWERRNGAGSAWRPRPRRPRVPLSVVRKPRANAARSLHSASLLVSGRSRCPVLADGSKGAATKIQNESRARGWLAGGHSGSLSASAVQRSPRRRAATVEPQAGSVEWRHGSDCHRDAQTCSTLP